MELIEQLLAGNRRSLARVISHVENQDGDAHGLLAALYAHTGRGQVIGVTGAPGTGKSTLVNALTGAFRGRGLTVGIIAVDPTSPFSGGALLGDRVRMRDLAGDPGVFIRSMATRGSLGGLAHTTQEVALVLDAAGFDRILIETVGVGQDELEVARIAHTTVVVVPPGLGDEIQAIKAGILEVADVFCVNKADREGADATVRDLETMIGMSHEIFHSQMRGGRHHGAHRLDMNAAQDALGETEWLTPIVKTVAMRGQGIEELTAAIEKHRTYLFQTKQGEARRRERVREEALSVLNATVMEVVARELKDDIDAGVERMMNRAVDPYTLARELLQRFRK